MAGLQVHPELSRVAEETCQQQSGFRRDPALATNQFVHAVLRNSKRPGQIGLAQLHGFKKFVQQNFPGMAGDTVSWQHSFSLHPSMIVRAANVHTASFGESEDNPILVVHANAKETGQIAV
jgi:hypothetical protein